MASEREGGGLSRIVALRPCGHVAAFASVEELLRGQSRCPQCERAAASRTGAGQSPGCLDAGRAPRDPRRTIG